MPVKQSSLPEPNGTVMFKAPCTRCGGNLLSEPQLGGAREITCLQCGHRVPLQSAGDR